MVDFQVRKEGQAEDAVFNVGPLVDTANPFGDFCVIKIDDRNGQKFEEYDRGTKVDVDIIEDAGTDVSNLRISTTETVSTSGGVTDTYGGTVTNQGTYSNQGTVVNDFVLAQQPFDIDSGETVSTGVLDTDRFGSAINNAGTYSNQGQVTVDEVGFGRFAGYVVERREGEQQGSDTLEVEAYSFDQFLRRNTVSTNLTGKTIPEALESIVDNDSPVTYNSSKVEVVDDQELTRSFRGEPVEEVLRDLAFKSGNENFGVDDSLEFFFRPRESVHIDRGIDNTQWIRYDIPELGKEVVNEVEVWYNDGNESVIVDAPTDKLDLQDNLGLANPGTQRAELQRPQITTTQDAEDVGRRYLQFRNATLSGTVTTYGLYEAEPGDTIDITIDPRGIDTEFVIASVEYRWGVDETTLTIVEKRGDQDDILFELNDSVKRQELEGADRDAPSNRVTSTDATALFDVSVDADGNMPDAVKFVNLGRNAVRDAWSGQGNPDVSTITVGSDGSGLSRSNTNLANQTNSATTTQSLPDATTARYEASITQLDVQEIGLETSGGTLISRATFDTPVDLSGTVQIDVSVSNDDSVSRGVLTNDGQTAVRDVLADNNPDLPTDYAYGSDGGTVSESDSALGNQLKQVSLSEVLVQDADTDSEWSSITSISSTSPITINNGQLQVSQSTFIQEAETASGAIANQTSRSDFSDAPSTSTTGAILNNTSESLDLSFDLSYTVNNSDFEFYIRAQEVAAGDYTAMNVYQGSDKVSGDLTPNTTTSWISTTLDGIDAPSDYNGSQTLTLEPNRSLAAFGNTFGKVEIDIMAVVDNRFTYNFDNTDLTTVSRNVLNGPELYPDVATQALSTAISRRNISKGVFDSTWNDITNKQFIEVSPDGINYQTFNNTSSSNYTFSNSTQSIDVNLGLSRYPMNENPQNETPKFGYNGQAVDLWELFVNPDTPSPDDIGVTNARAIVPPNSGLNGETVREAGLKNGSILLTRHQLAEFVVAQDQRLASSEQTAFKGDE